MQMTNLIRRKVSQNRKRLVEGRYDLDLTYITHNIIAMGYPSDKALQSLIRNKIESVSKFLNERHPDSYRIFNLCIESDYDFSFFKNQVERIALEDHNPPTFAQILYFCNKVDEWLKKNPNNVAVIHCKAGKGRTGTMISNYFLHTKRFSSPFEAMDEFDRKRCKDSIGVTIPSQRRYVEYYYDYLINNRTYSPIQLKLNKIKLSKGKVYFSSSLTFQIMYRECMRKFYDSSSLKIDGDDLIFEANESIILKEDIKLIFSNKKKECVFSVCFNTFFLFNSEILESNEKSCLGDVIKNGNQITYFLKKQEIDVLCKNKKIEKDFEIQFELELVPENSSLNNSTASSVSSKKNDASLDKENSFQDKEKKEKRGILPLILSRFKQRRTLNEISLAASTTELSKPEPTKKYDLKRSYNSSSVLNRFE